MTVNKISKKLNKTTQTPADLHYDWKKRDIKKIYPLFNLYLHTLTTPWWCHGGSRKKKEKYRSEITTGFELQASAFHAYSHTASKVKKREGTM